MPFIIRFWDISDLFPGNLSNWKWKRGRAETEKSKKNLNSP